MQDTPPEYTATDALARAHVENPIIVKKQQRPHVTTIDPLSDFVPVAPRIDFSSTHGFRMAAKKSKAKGKANNKAPQTTKAEEKEEEPPAEQESGGDAGGDGGAAGGGDGGGDDNNKDGDKKKKGKKLIDEEEEERKKQEEEEAERKRKEEEDAAAAAAAAAAAENASPIDGDLGFTTTTGKKKKGKKGKVSFWGYGHVTMTVLKGC